jgi:tRNA threonylcarbamoyladenosine biosynthesis protein TsaE
MEKRIHSLAELESEAKAFLGTLVPDTEHATLVTLSGELGAGKTAFTKAIARTLGVTDTITSPTFVLEKIYPLPTAHGGDPGFSHLVHIDAYRLKDASEAAPLTLETLMQDPQNLILLEWPEKIEDALPAPSAALTFVVYDDGSRTITYG